MSPKIGLEDLPIDALEHIANYLSVNDISNCGAVSRTWYNIFNNEILWKSKCNGKLDEYLTNSKCQVVPVFSVPRGSNCTLPPLNNYRLNYMREQHLWRNWSLGTYKADNIILESIKRFSKSEDIYKIEFVANDILFFHTLLNSEIWDVSQKPCHIMTIPFGLKRRKYYFNIVCKAAVNRLIVIQENVVQIFNISLSLKSWSFDFAFFFDQPEEFSSNITEETDLGAIFKNTSYSLGKSFVIAICGDYLVGSVITKESMKNPSLQVWNVRTGKKIKEQPCHVSNSRALELSYIWFDVYEKRNIILVKFSKGFDLWIYGIYDLATLQFLVISEHLNDGRLFLCGEYLCHWQDSSIQFHDWLSNINTDSPDEGNIFILENGSTKLEVFNDTEMVLVNDKEVAILNPKNKSRSVIFWLNFNPMNVQSIHGRYLAFLGHREGEICQVGNPCKKVLSYTFNSYINVNELCTKIAAEGEDGEFIVLNFW